MTNNPTNKGGLNHWLINMSKAFKAIFQSLKEPLELWEEGLKWPSDLDPKGTNFNSLVKKAKENKSSFLIVISF